MRVAIYIRVSTAEQKAHGYSVDNQLDALTKYAKEHNYTIANVYNDAGLSASKTYKHRPELLRMLKDCQKGIIDLVLFTKLDRFFRSVPDYYACIEQMNDVPWQAIWEDYETITSAGKFKVNIMLSIAQAESDRTSERIRATNEYKRSLGQVCTGGVALGYVIKDKQWHKDEKMEKYVAKFFEVYLATFSIKLATKACDDLGYHFTSKNCSRFIRNPAYYAEPNYVAEAYITKEQHELIEPHIKKQVRVNKYVHLFNGIIYCEHCGGRLSPVGFRKNRSMYHPRYTCANRAKDSLNCIGSSVREAYIESYLLDELDTLLADYRYKIDLKADEIDVKAKISQLKSRLNRLKDLYEMGDIELLDYRTKRDNTLAEISELESINISAPPVLPDNWKEIYLSLDKEHKKAFWDKTIKKIVVAGRMEDATIKIFF